MYSYLKYVAIAIVIALSSALVGYTFSAGAHLAGVPAGPGQYTGIAVGLLNVGIMLFVTFVVVDELVFRDIDTERYVTQDGNMATLLAGLAIATALCLALA
jgi:hypothetical protein